MHLSSRQRPVYQTVFLGNFGRIRCKGIVLIHRLGLAIDNIIKHTHKQLCTKASKGVVQRASGVFINGNIVGSKFRPGIELAENAHDGKTSKCAG